MMLLGLMLGLIGTVALAERVFRRQWFVYAGKIVCEELAEADKVRAGERVMGEFVVCELDGAGKKGNAGKAGVEFKALCETVLVEEVDSVGVGANAVARIENVEPVKCCLGVLKGRMGFEVADGVDHGVEDVEFELGCEGAVHCLTCLGAHRFDECRGNDRVKGVREDIENAVGGVDGGARTTLDALEQGEKRRTAMRHGKETHQL